MPCNQRKGLHKSSKVVYQYQGSIHLSRENIMTQQQDCISSSQKLYSERIIQNLVNIREGNQCSYYHYYKKYRCYRLYLKAHILRSRSNIHQQHYMQHKGKHKPERNSSLKAHNPFYRFDKWLHQYRSDIHWGRGCIYQLRTSKFQVGMKGRLRYQQVSMMGIQVNTVHTYQVLIQ